ncbi:MAG: hypothetical protein ABH862_01090 [Candidatus Omnitrophota bacterium]
MKNFCIMILALCFLGNVCSLESVAQPANSGGAASQINVTELTRDDIITRINVVLDQNLDIRAFTPGLEERTLDNDVVYYEYETEKIEDLNEEALLKLLRNVNQQIAWKDFRRLQKQQKRLDELKKLSQLPRSFQRAR